MHRSKSEHVPSDRSQLSEALRLGHGPGNLVSLSSDNFGHGSCDVILSGHWCRRFTRATSPSIVVASLRAIALQRLQHGKALAVSESLGEYIADF